MEEEQTKKNYYEILDMQQPEQPKVLYVIYDTFQQALYECFILTVAYERLNRGTEGREYGCRLATVINDNYIAIDSCAAPLSRYLLASAPTFNF